MLEFRKNSLIFYAVVICVVLFLANLVPALRPATLPILKSPLKLFTLVGREFRGIMFYHENYLENAKFKNELDWLKSRLNAAGNIYLENKRLKQLLKFKEAAPYKMVAASVIARAADNWSSVIIIDKGISSGIKRGDVVISYLGLVGRVIEASGSASKILLINDPSIGVSSLNQRSRQEGLVSGTLGSSLVMKYLPRDADLKLGDTIVTSGLSNIYPKGLLIGSITEIGEEFSGLSRFVTIKPAVNLSSIEEVLVIIQ